MTNEEYILMLQQGSKGFRKANASQSDSTTSCTQSKHITWKALHDPSEEKARSFSRCTVSFTCYRVRKQDPDNAVVKWFVDALRRAKLLYDDTEEDIEITIKQIKCSTRKEERTEIKLIPL